jgi:uncharacterized membrane protein YccF (DUF307 family)
MTFFLNVIWVVFFGWPLALGWFIAALIMALSIIGLPWTRAAFTLGAFALWPFGRIAVRRDVLYGPYRGWDIGVSGFGVLGNALWFILAGWWLALGHAFFGLGLCLTVIGIPFGIQHFKFARLALTPIGNDVIDLAATLQPDVYPRR